MTGIWILFGFCCGIIFAMLIVIRKTKNDASSWEKLHEYWELSHEDALERNILLRQISDSLSNIAMYSGNK